MRRLPGSVHAVADGLPGMAQGAADGLCGIARASAGIRRGVVNRRSRPLHGPGLPRAVTCHDGGPQREEGQSPSHKPQLRQDRHPLILEGLHRKNRFL